MKVDKKKLRKLVNETFDELVNIEGYEKTKKLIGFYKIKGDFVHVILVDYGRSIGSLYLYVFTNLLTDPWCKYMSDYSVGNRFDNNPMSKNRWVSENETYDEIKEIIEDMALFVKEQGVKFFNNSIGYKNFFIESFANVNPKIYPIDLAISLLHLGKYDKVYWMCDDLLSQIQKDNRLEPDTKELMIRQIKELQRAADNKGDNQLFIEWKDNAIEIIKSK